jgi:uncharacterized protein (DUF1800 family)
MKLWLKTSAVLLLAAQAGHSKVHDHLFKSTFDFPAEGPTTANDAARFLTQATFGPNKADISYLMAQGYDEWIDEQLAKATTRGEATVEAVLGAHTGQVSQTYRLNRFYWQAVYAPDQLRQRMAFALSQIFVVSDQSSAINGDVVSMAHYQDLLASDAFVNFGKLMSDVTYHPTMGKYLNAFHNTLPVCKGPVATQLCTSPDENYAREVMQLFSVGLVMLGMDGEPVLTDPMDLTTTVATYDQSTITHTAKIFTGFTYSDAPTDPANFFATNLTFAGGYNPMACWGEELFSVSNPNMKHDITGDDGTTETPKTVLGGATIASGQTCAHDVSDEMVILASHQNVPPFISRQLIQRFVTSTPSAAYIGRVSAVFDTAGNDLGDVIKAILTDQEARQAPPATFGKLREPVLRLTAMWRAYNAQPPVADSFGEIKMLYGGANLQGNFGQNPLEAPTVFNFYSPDYQQPGKLTTDKLNAPEFQITDESSVYTTANVFYNFTANAYVGLPTVPTDRPSINMNCLLYVGCSTSASRLTVNQMLDQLSNTLLYGTMSSAMRADLAAMLNSLVSGNTAAGEVGWSAIYITMLSPEYAVQR